MEVNAIDALRQFVARHDTQNAAAKALGVSAPYLSDVLNERRDLTDKLLSQLGLRTIVVRTKRGRVS